LQGKRDEEAMAETTERQARIAGRLFLLRSTDVRRALRKVEPEPVASHFVVDDRRVPLKQVISAVTGLDRADFTTRQARRTLMRLGFVGGRRGAESVRPRPIGSDEPARHRSRARDRWQGGGQPAGRGRPRVMRVDRTGVVL
jgi:hypothetical protein